MAISQTRTLLSIALVGAALFASAPLLASAQSSTASSQSDLSATIRAELLSDPRTSDLPQAPLDSMVNLLTQSAQKQGVTAHDITWRPVSPVSTFAPEASAGENDCGSLPSYLCALNTAFGLSGSDPWLAIALGIASGLVILVVGLMLQEHHRKIAASAVSQAAAAPPPPQP